MWKFIRESATALLQYWTLTHFQKLNCRPKSWKKTFKFNYIHLHEKVEKNLLQYYGREEEEENALNCWDYEAINIKIIIFFTGSLFKRRSVCMFLHDCNLFIWTAVKSVGIPLILLWIAISYISSLHVRLI